MRAVSPPPLEPTAANGCRRSGDGDDRRRRRGRGRAPVVVVGATVVGAAVVGATVVGAAVGATVVVGASGGGGLRLRDRDRRRRRHGDDAGAADEQGGDSEAGAGDDQRDAGGPGSRRLGGAVGGPHSDRCYQQSVRAPGHSFEPTRAVEAQRDRRPSADQRRRVEATDQLARRDVLGAVGDADRRGQRRANRCGADARGRPARASVIAPSRLARRRPSAPTTSGTWA